MKYIYAKDVTAMFVDTSVVEIMADQIDGPTTFDFNGVSVMDRSLEYLSEVIVEHGVKVIGLEDDSQDRLDSLLLKLNEPDFNDVGDYKEMFFAKFPVGTLCIWDKTLQMKKKSDIESFYSLVYIEGFEKNSVVFRVYHSHLVEPVYFHQYGGIHAKELYSIQRIHISDFVSKEVQFRYAKDEREEVILDLLSKAHML